MHKDLILTLKDLARHSTNKAVTGLDVSDADWKALYGMRINQLYQVLSAAVIKAVVSGVLHGAEAIAGAAANVTQQPREVTDRLNRANKIACSLGRAARCLDNPLFD